MKNGFFKKFGFWIISILALGFITYGCTTKTVRTSATTQTPTKIVVEKTIPAKPQKVRSISMPVTQQIKKVFRDIHFNFNKYKLTYINKWGIKQNVPLILDKIAKFMKNHQGINIIIEGNCDQRGTQEYNLALGMKRANAAKEYLISKNVSPNRIQTVSYGKERPLNPAYNEYAYAQNRRDHFVVCNNCGTK